MGLLDETAHLALGLLLARRQPRDVARGMIASSVLIDLDHAPSELGYEWLRPPERGRPYPHALVTVAAVAALVRDPRVRAGAVLGLLAHFGRDLIDGESGVRLLWPLTKREFNVAPWLYPIAVGALWSRR